MSEFEELLKKYPPVDGKSKISSMSATEELLNKYPPVPVEPQKVPKSQALKDVAMMTLESLPQGVGEYVTKGIPAMARSATKAATFGKVDIGGSELAGSVMEPKAEKVGRVTGQLVGGAVPIILSELVAGIAIPSLVAKYGIQGVRAAINEGLLTGAIHGTAKGAVTGQSPLETTKMGVMDAATFGGLGAAGYGLGKLREGFNDAVTENLANYYTNTNPAIAKEMVRSNKPSLGKQYLESGEMKVRGRPAAYRDASSKLEQTKWLVDKEVESIRNQLKTPYQPNVEVRGVPSYEPAPYGMARVESTVPQLPYKPATIEKTAERPPLSMVEKGGDTPTTWSGDIGKREMLGDVVETQQTGYATQTGKTPLGSPLRGESAQVERDLFLKQKAIDAEKLSKEGLKHGPTISLNEIRDSIKPEIDALRNAGKISTADTIEKSINNIAQGRDVIGLPEGLSIRRTLDEQVGRLGHLKEVGEIADSTYADMLIADKLRAKISELSPKLAALMKREHFLINVKTSMEPEVAKAGVKGMGIGLGHEIVSGITGSAPEAAVVKILDAAFGRPSGVIAPTARVITRGGLSQAIEKKKQEKVSK